MSKAQPDAAAGEPEEAKEQPAKEPEKPNSQKEAEPGAPQQADNIEDLKKQIATLQDQLKESQKNNINQNYANTTTPSDEDQLAAIMKGFM